MDLEGRKAATIRALSLAQLLQDSLRDGAHELTPSDDFQAELDQIIREADSQLDDQNS